MVNILNDNGIGNILFRVRLKPSRCERLGASKKSSYSMCGVRERDNH